MPYEDKNGIHTYNQFTIRVKNRKMLEKHLKNKKVPYGIYYSKPIYKYNAYKNDKYKSLPNVEKISNECLSLPIYPEMKLSNVKYICKVLNEYSS